MNMLGTLLGAMSPSKSPPANPTQRSLEPSLVGVTPPPPSELLKRGLMELVSDTENPNDFAARVVGSTIFITAGLGDRVPRVVDECGGDGRAVLEHALDQWPAFMGALQRELQVHVPILDPSLHQHIADTHVTLRAQLDNLQQQMAAARADSARLHAEFAAMRAARPADLPLAPLPAHDATFAVAHQQLTQLIQEHAARPEVVSSVTIRVPVAAFPNRDQEPTPRSLHALLTRKGCRDIPEESIKSVRIMRSRRAAQDDMTDRGADDPEFTTLYVVFSTPDARAPLFRSARRLRDDHNIMVRSYLAPIQVAYRQACLAAINQIVDARDDGQRPSKRYRGHWVYYRFPNDDECLAAPSPDDILSILNRYTGPAPPRDGNRRGRAAH